MKKNEDLAFDALIEVEKNSSGEHLFFLDENWQSRYLPSDNCFCISNRFDIHQYLMQKEYDSFFNDFDTREFKDIDHCFIRISKEKLVNHHLINSAIKACKKNAEIHISGYEKEGFKSLIKRCEQHQLTVFSKTRLKKGAFIATIKPSASYQTLDDNDYCKLRPIENQDQDIVSKPGIFGWNKLDEGSIFLLDIVQQDYKKSPENILDLGCGYGLISLGAKKLWPETRITATDNNAAAILACEKNLETYKDCTVIADDCAKNIQEKFKLILCNPPFHQGFATDKPITETFLESAKNRLRKSGTAYFVLNNFIGVEKHLPDYFKHHSTVAANNQFKVIKCSL